MPDVETWVAELLLVLITVTLLAVFVTGIIYSLIPWLTQRREARAFTQEIATLQEIAPVEDALREELVAVERKVHYRHNIHCPACGRFARQAEGFPSSVSDCRYHGIMARTIVETGVVAVVLDQLPIDLTQALPETSPLFIEAPVTEYDDILELGVKIE